MLPDRSSGTRYSQYFGVRGKADSYYRNIGPYIMQLNGISSHIIRAKLLVKVTDDLTLSFIGFGGQHSNANGQLGNPLDGISQGSDHSRARSSTDHTV